MHQKLNTLYNTYSTITTANPLYIEKAKKFVHGYGNPNAKIVFIGESPGAEEDIEGIPFQGRSGKLLLFYLKKYNFSDSNSFITNVLKFRPPNNRKPTPQEILIHGRVLREELEIINPKILVAIGATAADFLLENEKISISKIRGTCISKNNIIIYPLFHPAYILRNKNLLPTFENDIENLQNISIKMNI